MAIEKLDWALREDDGEPMSHAEWVRFGTRVRTQCRWASGASLALAGLLFVDALCAPIWAWHWWALLSAYAFMRSAYHWFDARFWKLARLEARRMRRVVARHFPEDLADYDRRFPDAVPTRPPEPSEPPP